MPSSELDQMSMQQVPPHLEPAVQPVRRYPLALFGLMAVISVGLMAIQGTPVAARSPLPRSVAAAVEAPSVVVGLPPAPKRAHPAALKAVLKTAPRVAVVHPRTTVTRRTVVRHVAAVPVAAPIRPAGDAYPYRNATTNAADAWGFTQRQCVSYVAWRLSVAGHAVSNRTDGWGSASNWDDTARRMGVSVTSTPRVGSVAQWDAGEASEAYGPGRTRPNGRFVAGGYGHVAYVTAVYADGSVQVAQYNAQGDRVFSSLRLRAPRFLALA